MCWAGMETVSLTMVSRLLLVVTLGTVCVWTGVAEGKPPNMVFMLMDDVSWQTSRGSYSYQNKEVLAVRI